MSHRASSRFVRFLALGLAVVALACGDDDGGTPRADGGSPPADGGGTDTGMPGDDAMVRPDGGVTFITPDDPGPADVRFTIHTGEDLHPISPFIYGSNSADFAGRDAHLTLARSGGNRMTAYDWETNASNAGSDWMHQNDGYLSESDVPGEAVRGPIAAAHAAGAAIVVTVPMIGYVAADKNGGGDVAATPDYLNVRFHESRARKGAAFELPPDTTDDLVYQDEFVHWVRTTFPTAFTDPMRRVFFCLDNEPDLWSSTHARIHPDPVRYEELRDLSIEYASAIKDVVPEALVFGPVSYGWNGYVTLQDAPDAMGRDFLDWYLAELRAAETAAGRRLLDVLDLHWYPEAQGGGMRITTDDSSDPVAAARMQAPRSLWDPTYTEDSWIAMWSTMGPIRLLPRLREKIDANYPGTRVAITEYYYGGGDHISGGIAQADVLGIFGREDVFAAALWHLGSTDDRFIRGGFDAFRNYDGAGGAFGDVSARATTDDVESTSIYASYRSTAATTVVLVAINKTSAPLDAGIAITHLARLTTARPYVLTSAAPTPVAGDEIAITATNAFVHTLPPLSVTTFALE